MLFLRSRILYKIYVLVVNDYRGFPLTTSFSISDICTAAASSTITEHHEGSNLIRLLLLLQFGPNLPRGDIRRTLTPIPNLPSFHHKRSDITCCTPRRHSELFRESRAEELFIHKNTYLKFFPALAFHETISVLFTS